MKFAVVAALLASFVLVTTAHPIEQQQKFLDVLMEMIPRRFIISAL